MKTIFHVLTTFLVVSSCFSDVKLDRQIAAYLADKDIRYSELAEAAIVVVLRDADGNQELVKWPSYLGPKPRQEVLPQTEEQIQQKLSAFELRVISLRHASKSATLKQAEKAFVTFFKTNGWVASTSKTVTKEEILAAQLIWDALPDGGQTFYTQYFRLVSRIELANGSEYDTWEHR